jgi:hypothetical protein
LDTTKNLTRKYNARAAILEQTLFTTQMHDHFEIVLILPTTQCACADFEDFASQRNGGGREKN